MPGSPCASHQILEKWLDQNKIERRGRAWEQYLADPRQEPDTSKWRTLILWPIK